MEINKSNQVRNVAFQGYQHKKTDTGAQAYEFNCVYDSSKYDCEVQFFRVGIDKKNNFFVERGSDGSMEPFFTADVPKSGVVVEPRYDLDLEDTQPFAYRMVIKDKNTGNVVKYIHEDNNEKDGCSIVTRKGTSVTKQGPMYLAMHDSFAPGYVYAGFNDKDTGKIIKPETADEKKAIADKIRNSNRTFANSFGGSMAGLEAKLHELREKGFKRLITTPLKGASNASRFGYWNENNMLMAGGAGTINNYNSLQREAFKNGMNLVDDGTFTSEGLQGIHFQRAIKWMDNDEKPAEYYYFRMSGLKDNALGMGVIPANYENLNHKLVNSPFEYSLQSNGQYKISENKKYDPDKPTTLQIFDNSMVTDKERKDTTSIIDHYSKTNPNGNKLAINTHDDTVIPYAFEVDPYEYRKNVENLNEVNATREKANRVKLDSPRGTMFVGAMSGISIEEKNEGGFVCWNAYTDMSKLNYFTSNYDNELLSDIKDPAERAVEMNRLRRANAEVQDLAAGAAKYWTRHVRNVHNEYVAKTIGEISDKPAKAYNRIEGILNSQNPDNPKLPEDVRLSRQVIQNVLEDNYEMRPKSDDYDELLISSLMELPLDSIEFAPDMQGALSSPYLSKRSPDEDHIGQSRYEAMVDSTYNVPKEYAKTYDKMNSVFKEDIKAFADKVLNEVDKNSKEPLFDGDNLTEYGQYVIPLVAEDIAKYAIVKAFMPDAKVKKLENGEIAYDYDDMMKKGTLKHFGINGDSQENEASQIVNRMKKGISNLETKDIAFVASSINKRIQNTNANSFKLAEVMVDRSGLGLDWRFDAAKDVADFDSVRNGDQRFDTAWNNNIKFWGNMVEVIKKENPNSYTVAELTDVDGIIRDTMPDNGDVIYDNEGKAIGSLLDLAGITSEANYSYFFDGITNMFGYDFVTGDDKVGNKDSERIRKLEDSISRFADKPIDYKRNSYTFASNHDKPRMVHFLSMDMSLYNADLMNKDDVGHRKTAYMIMNDIMNESELSDYDKNIIYNDNEFFKNSSAKAVANGELLRNSIGAINNDLKNEEKRKVSESNISEDKKQAKYAEIDDKYNKLYSALSKSVADVVNGKYYKNADDKHSSANPDSYKKVLEKDGFGSKPIPDAFDIVFDQAEEKYGVKGLLDKDALNNYRNRVDSKATEVGRVKTRMIMRYLGALSGNPTLYAGDELGMTGGEDKCQNTYLQNRNALDESVLDKDSGNFRADIADYRNQIMDISANRKDDDINMLEALNNGTMYKLDKQSAFKNGSSEVMECSAVMSQASNGAMTISVFNPNGVSTDPKVPVSHLHPSDAWLDSIYLKGPKGKISLNAGTIFKNVNPNDNAIYKVCNNGDDYFIKRIVDGKEDGILMDGNTSPDGVMMLYHIPENVANERTSLINKKTRVREYFNHMYNIPKNNAYADTGKPEAKKGKNIDVTSK